MTDELLAAWRRRLALVRQATREEKRSTPTGGGAAPAVVPAKPPDALGAAPPPAAAEGAVPPSPFVIPPLSDERAKTLSQKQLRADAKRDVRLNGPRAPLPELDRPRVRGDCEGGDRPCPFVGCRHHTAIDVTEVGSIQFNRPQLPVEEHTASCSLDVADAGPLELERVGQVLNITRERVRQIEEQALVKAERAFAAGEVRQFRGSCKAVCALSGRRCQLPAHADNVKHHDGRRAFHLVATPGQTHFAEKERLERAATTRTEGEAAHG